MECRLCLCSISGESFVPIFDDQDLAHENIWSCCQLRVKKCDWLPNVICLMCDSNMKSLMDFKMLSFQSETTARRALTECTKIKVEEVMLDDLVWEDEASNCNSPVDQSSVDECDLKQTTKSDVSGGKKSKKHKCYICSKYYTSKINLGAHIKRHGRKRPFNCDTCLQGFCRKQDLAEHISRHTGKKPHNCDTCSKGFATKGQLTVHMKIHSGKKPHRCDICSRCFVLRPNLKVHMRSHTGERPYKCTVCSKGFVRISELKVHNMKSHTGERPHKCDVCSKGFVRKGCLKLHVKRHNVKKKSKK